MALPAVRALSQRYPTALYGPGFSAALAQVAGLDAEVCSGQPVADVGVILKPSFGAAWRWRHLDRRIGLGTAGRGVLLTDAVDERLEHRREGYARVAATLGVEVPHWQPKARRLGDVGLNPWSPSATVRWPHFRALADTLERPQFFAGPGEDAVRELAAPHPVHVGLSLPDFAEVLRGCSVFVSNDSGAAHFADFVGVPVVMIHGSTDPARTGVGLALGGRQRWCGPCYRKRCPVGLGCMQEVGVEAVRAAVVAG